MDTLIEDAAQKLADPPLTRSEKRRLVGGLLVLLLLLVTLAVGVVSATTGVSVLDPDTYPNTRIDMVKPMPFTPTRGA